MIVASRNVEKLKPLYFSAVVKVLYVQNSESDIIFFSKQLHSSKTHFYVITQCKSFKQAEDALKAQDFDIIFLDLSLPDSSGIKTLENIRRINQNTAIIILTGYSDENTIKQFIANDAQDYIDKNNFNIDTIEHTVKLSIERKKTQQQAQTHIHYDALTRLSVRSVFLDRLKFMMTSIR